MSKTAEQFRAARQKEAQTNRRLAKAGIAVVDEAASKLVNSGLLKLVRVSEPDTNPIEYVKGHYQKFTKAEAEKHLKMMGAKDPKLSGRFSYYRVSDDHLKDGDTTISRPYLQPYGASKDSRARIQNAVKAVALRKSKGSLKGK